MIRNFSGYVRCAVFISVFVVLLVVIATATGAAQEAPSEEFNKTFGGTDSDDLWSVVETSDGGFVLAGTTQSFSGGIDVGLIKTDSNGNQEFIKTFSRGTFPDVFSVVETSDGGFVLAGSTSFGTGDLNRDGWLIKTDSSGNEVFNKTFGGPEDDSLSSVVETSDGGLALAGTTQSFGAGKRNGWLIKTDSNGNEEFNETFGGSEYETVESMVETSDGGFALAGDTNSFDAGSFDGWLVKTDPNGNEEFNETFGGSDPNDIFSVSETSDGGLALAGETFSFGTFDGWLVKTDSNGNEEFNKTFGGIKNDSVFSVVETSDGGLALTGDTESFGAGEDDGWLIKTDSNGNEEFNETFGGTNNDSVRSVIETSDGGLALAGSTNSFGAGNSDGWLIKTDSIGLFTKPILGKFGAPPQNTGELNATLYEDLDGDGDGLEIGPAIDTFGEIFRRNLNGKQGLGLSQSKAEKFDWSEDSPSDTVTINDMISLFGEKFREQL